ncbi:MAG: FtsX-like permease family protein [Microthrixaceae bacterium]
MWKLIRAGLWSRKLRLFTTALAVALGVAFTTGTLVLTDTIGKVFEELFDQITDGTDSLVRGANEIDNPFGESQRNRVPATVEAQLRELDSVKAAEGFIQAQVTATDMSGEPLKPSVGPPTLLQNFSDNPNFANWTLSEGEAPVGPDQALIDAATAEDAGVAIGDEIQIAASAEPVTVTVVGLAKFGNENNLAGAAAVLTDLPTAQQLTDFGESFVVVQVAARDGVSEQQVTDDINEVLPDDFEAITGTAFNEETQSDIRQGLGFFQTFLLVFAVVAVVVGAFLIYNSFSILIAQRTQELGLMRAIGASRRQVLGTVAAEAAAVGVTSAIVGLGLGVLLASGMRALLGGLGIQLPAGENVVAPTTIAVALAVGIGVTIAAALLPARRASGVSPMEALRSAAQDTSGSSRLRLYSGLGMLAASAALLVWGVVATAPLLVGFGAGGLLITAVILGPRLAVPAGRLIGAPAARTRGVTGRLAQQNSVRNPARLSTTALALVIGVSIVGFVTVLGASIKASIAETVQAQVSGDLIVSAGDFDPGKGLPPSYGERIAELPDVAVVSPVRFGFALLDDEQGGTIVVGADFPALMESVDLGKLEGSPDIDADEIAVSDGAAERNGWSLGDTITLTGPESGPVDYSIGLIFENADTVAGTVLSLDGYGRITPTPKDSQITISVVDGASVAAVQEEVERVLGNFPGAEVADLSSFVETQTEQLDIFLNMLYVFLALAVFIALMGIANTLALSIFERTNEVGLLRAVGMVRSQVRSMIRWESVIIAVFGTVLGLLVGLIVAAAVMASLRDQGLSAFNAAPFRLAIITVLAAMAGVLAALRPARRAARMNVLAAIYDE